MFASDIRPICFVKAGEAINTTKHLTFTHIFRVELVLIPDKKCSSWGTPINSNNVLNIGVYVSFYIAQAIYLDRHTCV